MVQYRNSLPLTAYPCLLTETAWLLVPITTMAMEADPAIRVYTNGRVQPGYKLFPISMANMQKTITEFLYHYLLTATSWPLVQIGMMIMEINQVM